MPESLRPLEELVLNLRWCWHPETQDLFEAVDADAWAASHHDPVRFLGSVPATRLQALAEDKKFIKRLELAKADLDQYMTGDRWYQSLTDAPAAIGYFSPEFGITTVLPQYSGGLGILAGDHLKSASDLGVPILGVGLLYRHGLLPPAALAGGLAAGALPDRRPGRAAADAAPRDRRLRRRRSRSAYPAACSCVAHVWVAQVGRVPLLLMDSDIEDNPANLRDVTDQLYGGGSDHRLLQELLLGVGGIRAIRSFCEITGHPAPEVFHTNEGHAGFLGVERIREFIETDGLDFAAAVEKARAGTVFTTHTPVPAGIDRFPRELIEMQFGGENASPGMPVEDILALGAEDYEGGDPTVFNMAVMGFRLSGAPTA